MDCYRNLLYTVEVLTHMYVLVCGITDGYVCDWFHAKKEKPQSIPICWFIDNSVKKCTTDSTKATVGSSNMQIKCRKVLNYAATS